MVIYEQLINFETAKLLKEKCGLKIIGLFHTPNRYVLSNEKISWNWNYDMEKQIPAPTQAMVMKWLREIHNICISPYAAAYRYGFTIDKADTGSHICSEEVVLYPHSDKEVLKTWEEACEEAIYYALKNLI